MAAKGEGLAASVLAQCARGICVASGGDCERDRAPCVVSSATTSQDLVVVVAVVRLAGGRTIIRQRRSDGTEVVTLVESGGAGLELTAGGSISVGGAEFGGAASGSFSGRISRGRAWTVPSAAAAEQLMGQLSAAATTLASRGRPPLPRLRRAAAAPPPAEVTFGASGLSSIIGGRLAAAGISFEAEDLVGERLNHVTGQRTLTIARRNELLADLSPLPASGFEGGLRRSELYTLTLDRSGNPIDIGVFSARRFHAGAKLPGAVTTLVPGVGSLPLRQGMLVEVEQHLDLSSAASREAAASFIAALSDRSVGFGPAVKVAELLKARINSDGVTLVRSYGIEGRRSGFGGKLGAGVGLAGSYQRSAENAILLDARVRGIDQNWRARSDCLRR